MKDVSKWLEHKEERPDGSTASIPTKWAVLDVEVEKEMAIHAKEVVGNGGDVLLVFDRRSERFTAAVERQLQDKGLKVHRHKVPNHPTMGSPPTADDTQVASARKAMETHGTTLNIAVGAGTLNDIAKTSAHEAEQPYFSYGTAASMNGYTSAIAALYVKGLKSTVPVTAPLGVFADPEVLADAPRALTLAGLGDLCSKPFANADAQIAALLQQQSPWDLPSTIVDDAFERTLDDAELIGLNEPQSIADLMKALWISGFSMTLAGTSSPASGGEHLWSHRFDMMRHDADKPPIAYHGTQVGVACGLVRELFDKVSALDEATVQQRLKAPISEPDPSGPSFQEWLEERHPDLGGASMAAVKLQAAAKYERGYRNHIREQLATHWKDIQTILQRAHYHAERVDIALQRARAPREPVGLGIDPEESARILHVCRDIRNRLTILDLAADLIGGP